MSMPYLRRIAPAGAAVFSLGAIALATTAHATAITVLNPGFEQGSATQTTGFATGWSSNDATDQYNPYEFNGGNQWYVGANPSTDPVNGGAGYPGIQGEYLGYLYNAGSGATLSQTLSANMLANTTYVLSVAVGYRNGTFGGTFGGATLQLYAGSSLLGSATYGVTSQTAGSFVYDTLTVDTAGLSADLIGQALQIQFHNATLGSTDFDNVTLNAASDGPTNAPEPSSLPIMVTAVVAGAGLKWLGRR